MIQRIYRLLSLLALLAPPALAQQFSLSGGAVPGPSIWSEGVTCADVDLDGDLDAFFANGNGFNSAGTQRQNVLLINKLVENGSFSFADESVARLGARTSNAKGVATADIDGDGYEDALYTNAFNTDPIFIYHNRGVAQPGFFDEEGAARGFSGNSSSAGGQFADVDNDGDLDLVLCESGSSFLGGSGAKPRLFINDGTGVFSFGNGWSPGLKVAQMDVQFGDLDGDWDLDCIIICRANNSGGDHFLMVNDGTGSFTDMSTLIPGTSSLCYEAELADLDGDSDLDLFFISLSGFAEGVSENTHAPSGPLAYSHQPALSISEDDNEVALCDFDMDGDLDAFIGSLGARERVWRNNGGMNFTGAHTVVQGQGDSTLDLTFADVDNDGDYDLITAQGESGAFGNKLYLNSGPADTLAPVVKDIEELAELVDTTGPWVLRAKVRDQVRDDGVDYLRATATFVVNPSPVIVSVQLTASGFVPAALAPLVPGTHVVFQRQSGGVDRVVSTTVGYEFDSGVLAVGESFEVVFVRNQAYSWRDGGGANTGGGTVMGATSRIDGLHVAGGMFRFAFSGDASASSAELCYELDFMDWPGNETRVVARCASRPGGPGVPFCFGLGCPCGNDDPAAGCVNSTGSGALLGGSGSASLAADDLVLVATGCPPSNSGLFFGADTPFVPAVDVGDGLGCAGGLSFRYFPGTVNSSGTFTRVNLVSDAPVGFLSAGVTRHFQAWTRDVLCGPPPTPCPSPCGNNNNLSNSYSVTFLP